jgi:hypothetical protein
MFKPEYIEALNRACDEAQISCASIEVFYEREVMLIVTRNGEVGIEVFHKHPHFLWMVLMQCVLRGRPGSIYQEGNRILFRPNAV